MRRLFFALWPSRTTRNAVDALAKSMTPPEGRRVNRFNLHLTLEFLGSQDDVWMRKAIAAAGRIEAPAFEFVLNAWEYFSRSRVLVLVPADRDGPLFRLHRGLHETLGVAGFKLEQRQFRPHLTLFRDCKPASNPSPPNIIWPVRELALVESCPVASGVRYQPRWLGALSTRSAVRRP